jgi:quinohemoprotein amine dehydrogenase beta subunit
MRGMLLAAATLAAMTGATEPAAARDLLVTIAKPGALYVFDAAARELVRECPIEGDVSPGIIHMAPDGKVAYALVNRWQDVIGIDVESCERVFHAAQSEDDVVRRSIGSLAVSRDGERVYTVRNPVRHLPDRYEVMEPEFAIFEADAGTQAKPAKTFPAPRRSSIMQTGADGTVYVAGHDIYAVDPETGEFTVKVANRGWQRPTYSGPDVLAFWPVGSQNDEFLLLYSAAVYADETREELKDFVWGFSSVDLETGETEIKDFAPFEVIYFSAVRDPNADNLLYGVYTQLSKHDVDTGELIKRVDLPHTYYNLNISTDGKELYLGGTNDDIGVYDAETLKRIGEMKIPSGGDMFLSTLQLVQAE